jgi:hypothetical protein
VKSRTLGRRKCDGWDEGTSIARAQSGEGKKRGGSSAKPGGEGRCSDGMYNVIVPLNIQKPCSKKLFQASGTRY